MGRCKSKTTAKKSSNKSSRTRTYTRAAANGQPATSSRSRSQIVTRAASSERPMTATRDTTARRTSRKRHNDSASNPSVSKCPCRPGLRRNNMPKIVKLLMDAVNNDDTDQDTDGAETPTAKKTKVESVTQELQNNIGM